MKRLLFIYNPQAGKGIIKPHLANVVDTFTKAGYLVTVRPTQGKADATHVAARQGWWYDRVVCCGGDGTLSETVAGLLTLDAPPVLGYIPAGTTNDFSKNLGLPRGVEKAAAMAVEGTPRQCDMGRFNDRTFVYVAAFGIFTDVSYGTPQEFKNAFGHLAYLLEGATKLGDLGRGYHLTVEHDGGTVEGDFIYGMVSNTVSIGGLVNLPRDLVCLDDGQFEALLIRTPKSPKDWQSILTALTTQKLPEDGSVVGFTCTQAHFTSVKPLAWTVDGEYGGEYTDLTISNRPQALVIACGN